MNEGMENLKQIEELEDSPLNRIQFEDVRDESRKRQALNTIE